MCSLIIEYFHINSIPKGDSPLVSSKWVIDNISHRVALIGLYALGHKEVHILFLKELFV